MKAAFVAVALLLIAGAASCQKPRPRPVAAYSSGNSVRLASKAGRVVSTIKLPVRVGEFSFSPDLKKLVVITPHPGKSGGRMYLYSLTSGRLQRIPAHAVTPHEARAEVYSEPQISADGATLFFNTHPQPAGDLYETSGPIAEIDLESLRAKALESTVSLVTDGFLLSPSGREILLWDEGKVIDPNGKTLFDLGDSPRLEKSYKWALEVAWIGNSCLLYEEGKSARYPLEGPTSYFVLDLKTLKSVGTLKILGLPQKNLTGLVSYRFPYAIVKGTEDAAGDQGSAYFLVLPGGARTMVAPGNATAVHVLPRNRNNDLPTGCR